MTTAHRSSIRFLLVAASVLLGGAAGTALAAHQPPGGGTWRETPGYQYGRGNCGWGTNPRVNRQVDCRRCCENRRRTGMMPYEWEAGCIRFCDQMIPRHGY